MIKFIICEDNISTLERTGQTITKSMMKYDMDYKVYKFTGYTNELKELINEEGNIKVYILDVEMPGTSGLEIASEIREIDDDSYLVFVTSHPECKDDIFYSRLEIVDYISKQNRYQERIGRTIEHIMTKIYRNKYLKLPVQNKCAIHLTNGKEKYATSTLTKLEEELKPLFFKTHKSCLINLSNIKYIEYNKYTVYFKNGDSTCLMTPSARKELKEYARIL